MNQILGAFGQLLSPIGTLFYYLFFEPVFNILLLIYQAVHVALPAGAFAISIVLLTLLLRACLIPLTRKQLKSSRAMQEIQPKMKELQAQYRGDPQGLMEAQRALYKEHGVSPVSGCLPLIVQMPFLYALYYAFDTIIGFPIPGQPKVTNILANINSKIYPFIPHLAHQPALDFFWANLGKPDPYHILPVLAAVLTFIQLRMSMPVKPKRKPGGPAPDPTSQATSTMMYIMPAFTLFIGLNFPAGLALYWCVSTLFSAVQQYFLNGWGSLFVGIPGMEHLVPEPKMAPAVISSSAARPVAGRALAAATPSAPASGGGFGSILRQFRENLAAASSQVADQAAHKTVDAAPNGPSAGKGARNESNDESSFAITSKNANDALTTSSRARQRAAKAGPILVKPESREKGNPSENVAPNDAVESTSQVRQPQQEAAVAGVTTNGANGKNGGGNGATSTTVRPTSAPRKTGSGSAGGKNSSSARSRSGRAKGGR